MTERARTRTKNSYKKMKLLGKGGFAVVYSVKDLKYTSSNASGNGDGNGGDDDDGATSRRQSQYYAAKVVSKKIWNDKSKRIKCWQRYEFIEPQNTSTS